MIAGLQIAKCVPALVASVALFIAVGQGVAVAAPDSSGPSSSDSSDSSSTGSPGSTATKDTSPTDTSPTDISPTPSGAGTDDTPVDDTPLDDTPLDDTPLDDTPLDDTPLDDAGGDDAGSPGSDSSGADKPTTSRVKSHSRTSPGQSKSAQAVATSIQDVATSTQDVTASTSTAFTRSSQAVSAVPTAAPSAIVAAVVGAPAAVAEVVVKPLTSVTAPATQAQASQPGRVLQAVLTPVIALLGLSGTAANPVDPAAPTTPWLWTLVAAVRREFERLVSNERLSADPVQISQSADGIVTGSVNVTNPYNHPLSYQVTTQPTNGTVVVAADGTYTYTPNATTRATGGTDGFTVTVKDTGFHLVNFFGGGTVTKPVSVAVTPPLGAIVNPQGTGAHSVVLSGNRGRVFVLNTDNTVSVIDARPDGVTYSPALSIPVAATMTDPVSGQQVSYTPTVKSLASSADGSVLYVVSSASRTGDSGHQLSVIRLTGSPDGPSMTITQAGTVDIGQSPTAVAVSPDDSRVYVLSIDPATDAGTVSVIDPSQIGVGGPNPGAVTDTHFVGRGGSAMAVDLAGRVFVANSLDDTVSVIDPAAGSVSTIAVGGQPNAIAFGPGPAGGSGKYAYVANTLSNSVSVIDIAPGSATANQVVGKIVVGGAPSGIAASPDGKHLYVSQAFTNSVAIVDTASHTVTTRVATSGNGGPTGIVLGGDNSHALVTNLFHGTIDRVALTPTLAPAAVPGVLNAPVLGSTHGFQLLNLSSQPATLGSFVGNGTLQPGAPGVGTVVPPGTYIDFEVVVYGDKNNTVQPVFFLPVPGGDLEVAITTKFENVNTTRHIATCGSNDGTQCQALPGYKVALLDQPGTVVTLDAGNSNQVQQISQYLNSLCGKSTLATSCNFTATRELVMTGKQTPVGNAVANTCNPSQTQCTPLTTSVSVSKSISEQVQDSVQVSVQNNMNAIFDKVIVQVQVKFQHTWTEEHTFTQTVDVTVEPQQEAYVELGPAIYRDYGNFTVQMGNTTINLNDVYFDSPNPTGQSTYSVYYKPLSGPANG